MLLQPKIAGFGGGNIEILVIFAVLVVIVVLAKVVFVSPEQPEPAPQPTTRPKARQESFDPDTAHHPFIDCLQGRAHIVDGDTIVVEQIQVRLFGIDAPELNHPFGQKAKWALVSMCKGHKVTVELVEEDHFGRMVGKCHLSDGRDLSAEMVRCGLAIDWPKYSGGIYSALEVPDARRKMWLADARQKGRMDVWEKFEARQRGCA